MRKSTDKLEFYSPITMEGSWGARRICDKARSTMELWLDNMSGDIEWIVEIPPVDDDDEGDEMVEGIGLTFEFRDGKRVLVDYDGVMTLPDQAMDLLERNGIDCSEMRGTLND